ncbi:anti-sigma factor family protein [Achromobacter aloeverae]|uniref:Anti-sigma factor n=1 Tax=Achromobacter aloeverae TaxID=1750518 RepID=A0A4Q1HQK0_9BURK|nr:anti-sigma factor [Achromobacter aloeverae]RXN93137.1 anti-sigma factor [Achromobacter aloeverae]
MSDSPDDDDLHAYADGRLDDEAREAIERQFARHPDQAARARAWAQDARSLREELDALPLPAFNPTLDPAAIRAGQAARLRTRLAIAASLVLCLGLGTVGGWQARDWRSPDTSLRTLPMSDAIAAYKLMVVDRSAAVDFSGANMGDMQAWLVRNVGASAKLPDLSAAGFQPRGGRLFATEGGAAAMVLYQDAGGHTLSFYVRPPESPRRLLPAGQRADGGLVARYGTRQGLLFAVVGPQASLGETAVSRALDEQT